MESDPDDILLLLEAERHTLTPEQRQWHDNFSNFLRRNEIYTIEVAIRAAEIVRTEKGAQQAAALEDLTDNAKRNALERKLKAEVQMLTPEQREHHERWCADLPGNEPYTTEVAAKAARIIRTERPVHRTSELKRLRCEAEANAINLLQREQAESRRQTAHSEQKDERVRVERPQETEQPQQPQQPAQEFGTPIRTAETNTPERLNRQIGRYDELKRLSEQPTKEAVPAPIIAAWHATAHEVCDPKIPPSPPNSPEPPPNGPSGEHSPQPPTPPTPPSNPNQPLSANEVFQRFNDPALQARYQQDQQQRDQDTKSSLYSADTVTRSAARANTSPDGSRDTGLMADFVKTETKQKAAAEEAARAAEAARNLERSGGRGR